MKLVARTAFAATPVTKHDTLVRANLAKPAVDEEPMQNLVVHHLQPLKRHSVVFIFTVEALPTVAPPATSDASGAREGQVRRVQLTPPPQKKSFADAYGTYVGQVSNDHLSLLKIHVSR